MCNVLYCVTVDGVLHGMYQSVLSCNNFFFVLFCFDVNKLTVVFKWQDINKQN